MLVQMAILGLIEAIGAVSPETVAEDVTDDDVHQVRADVETIKGWLDRFIALLPPKVQIEREQQADAPLTVPEQHSKAKSDVSTTVLDRGIPLFLDRRVNGVKAETA